MTPYTDSTEVAQYIQGARTAGSEEQGRVAGKAVDDAGHGQDVPGHGRHRNHHPRQ